MLAAPSPSEQVLGDEVALGPTGGRPDPEAAAREEPHGRDNLGRIAKREGQAAVDEVGPVELDY